MGFLLLKDEYNLDRSYTAKWSILSGFSYVFTYNWNVVISIQKAFTYIWNNVEFFTESCTYRWSSGGYISRAFTFLWRVWRQLSGEEEKMRKRSSLPWTKPDKSFAHCNCNRARRRNSGPPIASN